MKNISTFFFYFFFSFIFSSILTISCMNFFEIHTKYLSIVFILNIVISIALINKSKISIPMLSRQEIFLSLFVSFLLIFPRIQYLLEPLYKLSFTPVCWDDWWHIQETSSLIFSEKYPPKSTFDQHYFFSFYYAPWIPGVFVYFLGILKTVKQAVFINCAIWQLAFPYMLIIISKFLHFKNKSTQIIFLLFSIFYGGADIFYGIQHFIHNFNIIHAEWWMAAIFGFTIQFSNFFTLGLWTPHHFISAFSFVFALFFLMKKQKNVFVEIISGILFSFSLFSSVFVFLGALPLTIYLLAYKKIIFRDFVISGIISFTICIPILWMYLGKNNIGFVFLGALNDNLKNNVILSFLLFLVLLIIDFFPAFLWYFKNFRIEFHNKPKFYLFLISIIYLISTFFISYSGANNYAMRGAIIPIFTLYYITAESIYNFFLNHKKLYFLFIPFFLGGIWELISFNIVSQKTISSISSINKDIYIINTDNKKSNIDRKTEKGVYWYMIENPENKNPKKLENPDIEIMTKDNAFRLKFHFK